MNTEMQDSKLILLVGQALFWPFIHWASHLGEATAWAQPLCYSETKKGEMVEFEVDKNKSKQCSEESRSQPGGRNDGCKMDTATVNTEGFIQNREGCFE